MIRPRTTERTPTLRTRQPALRGTPAKRTFSSLFLGRAAPAELARAEAFLQEKLAEAERLDSDLPDQPADLESWITAGVERVGERYREYLDDRRGGAPRRYFPARSHALHFLRSVAPTKLVDGAWLYGVLPRWQDPRFLPLVRTYLEELGEGRPDKNHVVLYRKLLAAEGIDRWDDLPDSYYAQGAIQLALAAFGDKFLPEVVGFNLGYEQLPLHLLVTSHELRELKIDPYYFVLHVTVDNADTGHARQAAQAVLELMPKCGDPREFWRRVGLGYRLNSLGAGTEDVIRSFDLGREVAAIFRRKAVVGQHLHSDRARIEGRTVNDWLSDPESATEFVSALERAGWIRRHRDPAESPFWKLIEGETAKMFGVFDAYERQVLHEWIAGDRLAEGRTTGHRHRFAAQAADLAPPTPRDPQPVGVTAADDPDVAELERRLADVAGDYETGRVLIEFMSPALHHTPAGLAATRAFDRLLR